MISCLKSKKKEKFKKGENDKRRKKFPIFIKIFNLSSKGFTEKARIIIFFPSLIEFLKIGRDFFVNLLRISTRIKSEGMTYFLWKGDKDLLRKTYTPGQE